MKYEIGEYYNCILSEVKAQAGCSVGEIQYGQTILAIVGVR